MIHYEHFTLENGLEIYLHEDKSTPMAAFNILYDIGSRDEEEHKTGFAHLFEHLMFGGSKNIPSYDEPLQKVGGENNAFTSPDITNYYITLPASNIETAFWLESDRMLSLSFDPKVLEVQQKVVIEEFKQRYLNQPYGDAWLKLRPLAYQQHPYRWATIGKEISHIENATMDDVKQFFATHYLPNRATLVIAGNISLEKVKALAEKWFSPIPSGKKWVRKLPKEPQQTQSRHMETTAKVPLDAIYKTYHTVGRFDANFHATDLLSDVLGRGKSSRLYKELVKGKNLFNSISSYATASLDPGLFVIHAHLNDGVSLQEADLAISDVVSKIVEEGVKEEELEKVKNQAESSLIFSEVELLTRATNLAFAANAGNAEWCNGDMEKIAAIGPIDLQKIGQEVLRTDNCSTLYYKKNHV